MNARIVYPTFECQNRVEASAWASGRMMRRPSSIGANGATSWKASRRESSVPFDVRSASNDEPSIERSSHAPVMSEGTSTGMRSWTVAGPSTAGQVSIVAVSIHGDAFLVGIGGFIGFGELDESAADTGDVAKDELARHQENRPAIASGLSSGAWK